MAFKRELGAFSEVSRRTTSGEVDFGLLPIENSLAGSVVGSYDVLAGGDRKIVGGVISPIHHCILGLGGASLDSIRRVMSHPVALAQCTRILTRLLRVEAVALYDTAGPAKEVAKQGNPREAAIASHRAAERYVLEILAENVEGRAGNQTRFLAVVPRGASAADGCGPDSKLAMRTTVLIEPRNTPRARLRVLAPFSERNINLSKLESRPVGEPWSYRFFLEFDTDTDTDTDTVEPNAKAAIAEVATHVRSLIVVGSYPRWQEN